MTKVRGDSFLDSAMVSEERGDKSERHQAERIDGIWWFDFVHDGRRHWKRDLQIKSVEANLVCSGRPASPGPATWVPQGECVSSQGERTV